MVNTFASLGIDTVLGNYQGFFNVTREVLLSDAVELLPKDRVVIEVLEDVEADDEVIRRCQELRQRGFQLALDDWIVDDPREALLPLVDLVKVDLPAVPKQALRKLTRDAACSSATKCRPGSVVPAARCSASSTGASSRRS